MARDLKAGDVLRTVGGTVRVASVEAEPVQPVFNLEVGDTQTYFVGASGVLVHDNSLVTARAAPVRRRAGLGGPRPERALTLMT